MNLKELRKNQRLTMPKLAGILGCHPQQIYNFESGAAPIPAQYIKPLSKALKIKESSLVDFLLIERNRKFLKKIK